MNTVSQAETSPGRRRFDLGHRTVAAAILLTFLIVGGGLWLFTPDYVARYRGEAEPGKIQDYIDFYAAGKLVSEGRGDEIYDLQALGPIQRAESGAPADSPYAMPFSNPPFVALAFAPLAQLPLYQAALIIGLAGIVLVGVAGIALVRLLGLSRSQSVCVGLGFITLWPVIATVSLGQMTLLLFLGWLGWISLQTAGRERVSGVAVALLLIKPTIAVFPIALLLYKRRWRTLQSLALVGAALALISILASGPEVLVEYPRSLVGRVEGDQFEFGHRQTFYGWNGFFWHFTPYGEPLHLFLTSTACVATLGVLYLAWRGPFRTQGPAFLHGCSALLLTSLLVNPHVLLHDLALIPLALALTARATCQTSGNLGPWLWIGAVVWVLLLAGPSIDVNFMTPLMGALLAYNGAEARRLLSRDSADSRLVLAA
jgi:hypothetical protein